MKNPEQSRIVTYQAVPESYEDLKKVHELLEQECKDSNGKTVIEAEQLEQIKNRLAADMPEREDIDAFVRKACKELIICRAFNASNVFTRYVFAGTVPFTSDLYQTAFAGAPGLEDYTMEVIAKRYIPPLYGPHLTNKLAAQIASEKARRDA